MKSFFLGIMVFLMAACSLQNDGDEEAMGTAQDWADAYFNADYHAAEALSTPESKRFLQFAASNTTQHDLDLLKETPALVEVDDFFPDANDSLRVVVLKVYNYVKPALLGQTSQQEDEGLFRVTVVKRSERWMVRMADLPRSEKQSRD
jgi:hypothetical protein